MDIVYLTKYTWDIFFYITYMLEEFSNLTPKTQILNFINKEKITYLSLISSIKKNYTQINI